MTTIKEWDNLLNTLVTYGQELLRYQEAHYSYHDEAISLSWKSGEDSGGNCWGGNAQYNASNQKQPEFIILDELLFAIDPDIKLKDFRIITSKINFEETSHREYYGNGNYYNNLILEKNDLIQSLKEIGYEITLPQLQKINKHFEEKAYAFIESNSHSINNKNKKGW